MNLPVGNRVLQLIESINFVSMLNFECSPGPLFIPPKKLSPVKQSPVPRLYHLGSFIQPDINLKFLNDLLKLKYVHLHNNIVSQMLLKLWMSPPIFGNVLNDGPPLGDRLPLERDLFIILPYLQKRDLPLKLILARLVYAIVPA